MSTTTPLVVATVLVIAAGCGGGDEPSAATIADGSDESTVATMTTTAAPTTASTMMTSTTDADEESTEPPTEPSTDTAGTAAPESAPESDVGESGEGEMTDDASTTSLDPMDLEPGTAIFVAEGQEYRFVRGDSIFDICEWAPQFGFGVAKLNLADGTEQGAPHLRITDDVESQVVVAVSTELAYVAGDPEGEDVAAYVEYFGITPPPIPPDSLESGDDVAAATLTVMNVITQELVAASYAIRC